MLIMIFIAIVVSFLFYYFIVKPYDYWKEKGVKQGDYVWIAGNNWRALLRKQSFAELVDCVYKQHPGVRYSGIYQFFSPILVLKDPDLIKQITIKDFDHFTDHKTVIPEESDPLWARNLLALTGKSWHNMRSLLSPSFTSSKMRAMFDLMSECAENFVQHFQKKNQDILTLEFKDAFTRFTNDVIATTAFGIQIDSLGQPNNTFYTMGKKITDFRNFWRTLRLIGYILMPRLCCILSFKVVTDVYWRDGEMCALFYIFQLLKVRLFSDDEINFFIDIVSETVKIREEKGIVRPDMINLLMEARKGVHKEEESDVIDTGFSTAQESYLGEPSKQPKEITNMDMTAQAMIFFLAGFDTVSGLMCFLTYELTVNPDVQDRLREEIRCSLEECGGKLTYEDLLKMKYMDMVISETVRKWPIAAATDRICTKPYTIQPTTPNETPLHLEKGASVWLPIFGIHRDPKYFPNPERFDPDRFSVEHKANIKPYTYFPFGLGPRNCIGSRFALLEVKIVLFHILQHFELVPVEKSTIPLKISKDQFNLTAEDDFWFGLKRMSV